MDSRAITTLFLIAGLLIPGGVSRAATAVCGAGTYTYTFTNFCTQTIFIGQNGPGSSSTPPQGGNWAVAPFCANDSQCGAGQTCSLDAGSTRGQCTCAMDSDCPGSAACVNHLCSTVATFCMPQSWSSGTFWPRTGCVLSNGTLNCSTGQCGGDTTAMTGGRLDCGSAGSGSGQNGPTPPIGLFEPTTTPSSANYDVSLNNGYNVQMKVTPSGGSGNLCTYAGCTSDLNIGGRSTSCPSNLIFNDPRGSGTAVGCYQPQDACLSRGAGTPVTPPPGLSCTGTIAKDALGNVPVSTTDCEQNAGGAVKYLDMYEAKNTADSLLNNTQATANGGTPTAYSVAGCPPETEFASSFVSSGPCTTNAQCTIAGQTCQSGQCLVTPPPGIGVCLQFVNDVLVPDWGCSPGNLGATCGQYKGTYSDALGYTCQAVQYSGGTAYPCVPSTISGLGTCDTTAAEGFYPGAGGLFNASWVQAGIQAGGGTTPYYETLRNACPAAYTWQYDDVSGGRSCTFSGQPSNGFNVELCPLSVAAPPPTTLAAAVLPGTRSVQVGNVATTFATVINTGASAGVACSIAPSPPVAGTTFSYQTTDSSTNTPTGTPNTPVDIPASGSRAFVLAFTPSAPLAPIDVRLRFQCSNSTEAPVVSGLNTFLLSAWTLPVADIVALVATLDDDGIVKIPGVGGTGIFAVATANVGANGLITVSADTGGANLPVTVTLCETHPATGHCVTVIGTTVTTQINAGATPTFGVFVKATGPVAPDPAVSRIFVRFVEQGVPRGAASVAAQTQ